MFKVILVGSDPQGGQRGKLQGVKQMHLAIPRHKDPRPVALLFGGPLLGALILTGPLAFRFPEEARQAPQGPAGAPHGQKLLVAHQEQRQRQQLPVGRFVGAPLSSRKLRIHAGPPYPRGPSIPPQHSGAGRPLRPPL